VTGIDQEPPPSPEAPAPLVPAQVAEAERPPQAAVVASHTGLSRGRRAWSLLSPRNIGIIYVLIIIIIVFSFWAPETFPTWQTAKTVVNQNAITGLIALALVAPLSARVFDLSIGSVTGFTNVAVAWLLVNHQMGVAPAIIVAVLFGVGIGVFNAIVIVGFGIDSFIGTLATGALVAAGTTILSDNQAIIGVQMSGSFGDIATRALGGVALPVFLMLGSAVALWYVLNYTVTGRRIYATGFNEGGARLAGINTSRLRFATLVVSGSVAGIAGVLLASQVNSGSPGIGPPYLLNAFAAAFLGATQFGGRFNAPGTVLAVLLLGTGNTGLILVGAPVWSSDMFAGAVLLLALAMTSSQAMASIYGRFQGAKGKRADIPTPPTADVVVGPS
jgi:ribose transport system permease protein